MGERSLTDADVDAIARRLALVVGGRRLVSATTLADLLDLKPNWVRAHARELGAIPVGDGVQPRLRFDPDVAIEALRAMGERRDVRGSRSERVPDIRPRRPRMHRAA